MPLTPVRRLRPRAPPDGGNHAMINALSDDRRELLQRLRMAILDVPDPLADSPRRVAISIWPQQTRCGRPGSTHCPGPGGEPMSTNDLGDHFQLNPRTQ
jgi:hypothetical protein